MTDINMVIRGLTCLARKAQDGTCKGCAYFRPFTDDPDTGWCDSTAIMNDAVELLKEQEQPDVVPCKACQFWFDSIRYPLCSEGSRTDVNWFCSSCMARLVYRGSDVCPNCGKKVNWDAAKEEGEMR